MEVRSTRICYACLRTRYYSKPSPKDRKVNLDAAFLFMTEVEHMSIFNIGEPRCNHQLSGEKYHCIK